MLNNAINKIRAISKIAGLKKLPIFSFDVLKRLGLYIFCLIFQTGYPDS